LWRSALAQAKTTQSPNSGSNLCSDGKATQARTKNLSRFAIALSRGICQEQEQNRIDKADNERINESRIHGRSLPA
jgi:hypothetical protein